MLVMGDKFERRQSQLDGNFERRISSLAGEGESSSRAEGSARFVRFGPLAIGLAAAAAISWWLMWREGSSERSPNESEK